MLFWVTEQFMKTARHASFYLASGAETGPLIIFVHGWPELSHSWRHQLRCFWRPRVPLRCPRHAWLWPLFLAYYDPTGFPRLSRGCEDENGRAELGPL
jgi:pimeloyl-ACP methyl ester carboxylesterase